MALNCTGPSGVSWLSRAEAEASLRLSLGRSTTEADIEAAAACISDHVDDLRKAH